MMKTLRFIAAIAIVLMGILPAAASDYLTYLTPERGYVEVTQTNDLAAGNSYYYILTSAEDNGLIVGIGAYEAKPGWASENSKALRYKEASSDPMLERSNYFTIERDGSYIGLRNIVYSADLFQTHNEAGFMYVNTFTDKNLDEWSYLTPTYQDGYWLLESGQYPLAEGDLYSGYLGPWNNKVEEGEAVALNRKNTAGDEAGRYRIFRIAKTDYERQYQELRCQELFSATADHPADATWLIVNPSFESGDVTGWTRVPNVTDDNEFTTRDYGMSGKEGGYLFNAYQWWGSNIGVTQTIEHAPSGRYELSAVICTWGGREVTLKGNFNSVTKTGIDDATGIPVSIPLTITDNKLTISAGSTGQWWIEGHTEETQTFFKIDNVRLVCHGIFLDGVALPLPDDDNTLLSPGQWYYYEVGYHTQYRLKGNINDMVYSTDGFSLLGDISTQPAKKKLTLATGRVYFKTSRSDATLSISLDREMEETTFTATALNVDGLPQTILGVIKVNADGPGEDGTKLISKYLAKKGYDIIGVSEDFNYHGSLMSALEDNYDCGTLRATLSIDDLSYPFDTDGLNLLWKKGLVDKGTESWTRWNTTTSTDGNQYVKKGFRHYEMTPAEGMVIDVYVLHMDAGDKSVGSRESQWAQLAEAIGNADSNRPKLVIGDTNSRWTREDIKGHFFDLLPQYNISDAWVQLCRNNEYPTTSMNDITNNEDPTAYANYEVVDKIIYLNPKADNTAQLSAKSFKIERDYIYAEVDGSDNGNPLGDHKPVVVEFACVKSGDVKPLLGDVNRDGIINVSDIMATLNIVMGQDNEEPFKFDHVAANANNDNDITISDVMCIVNMVQNGE